MAKKQTSKKPSTKTRKGTKPDAAVPATWPEKKPKVRERDPRLPAAGTTLTRTYKGKEHRVTVLEAGFRYEGKEYRSLTALAQQITGYPAISGPAWWGVSEKRTAAPKPDAAKETPAAPATKARAPKAKRAGRDPTPEVQGETATEAAPAAPESAMV